MEGGKLQIRACYWGGGIWSKYNESFQRDNRAGGRERDDQRGSNRLPSPTGAMTALGQSSAFVDSRRIGRSAPIAAIPDHCSRSRLAARGQPLGSLCRTSSLRLQIEETPHLDR